MSMSSRKRTGSRPAPIKTDHFKYSIPDITMTTIVPPLTPKTERELRKSCSLLILQPQPQTTRVHVPHIRSTAPPRTETPPPPSSKNPDTNTATAVYGFGYARTLSVGASPIDLRASQIEIRRVMAGAGSGEGNISNRGSTTIADRTSTFLLARPTLVDVLPSPTINRPQTASGTPARSSSMWHDGAGGITDYSPMQRTPDFAAMHRSQFDMNAHSKTMSGDSGRRFSLFPRPQTATGGERPLSLAPSPGAALRKEVTGSTLRTEITTAMPSKKTKEKHELREKHELKEKSTKGFIQFSAFFKATFRFGKSRKDDRARSASVATALS